MTEDKDMLEFVDIVKKMRAKQKEYFKTRKYNVMIDSKALEKQVDDMLRSLTKKPVEPDKQGSLF